MRMWMVEAGILCTRHLLGEHAEIHMYAGSLGKGMKLSGYLENNLLEPASLLSRHDELAREMRGRGMNHSSPLRGPLPRGSLSPSDWARRIDRNRSLADLLLRCPECSRRYAPVKEARGGRPPEGKEES